MVDSEWTIQSTLSWIEDYLAGKADENPRISAQWLMSDVTGMSRIELYAHFDQPLSMQEREILRGYVTRRGKGEPLQYITGETGFRYLTLKVAPGVLIPRPETEVLVSEVLALLPARTKRVALDSLLTEDEAIARMSHEQESSRRELVEDEPQEADHCELQNERTPLVLDLCTGSGCIACSIAYEHPNAFVIATDISDAALALAAQNVKTLGLSERVRVLKGDLEAAVPTEYIGRFDVIASNPPYIPTQVLANLPQEVAAFEPRLALDGGDDGLKLFRRIAAFAMKGLRDSGSLVVELHETTLDRAADIALAEGFASVGVVKDLAGKPRVLVARKR